MVLIARKTLGRIGADTAAEVDVGVRIHLSSQADASDSNEQGVTWMHKTRDGTRLRFSPIKRIELERFCSCPGLDRPETVTWALQARSDPIEMKSTERYLDVGYVDVGYVRKGQGEFEFMPDSAAPFETLPVWVEVTECTRTHSTERVSPQAWSPMETGELQGAMANPPRSDSNSCASNLLHGPGSLPQSYHHIPSVRHQGQPTVSEGGFGTKTVVNIAKVIANNVDLASMLHPQGSGRESYVERKMKSATETCLASGRAGSDQYVEETDRKSLTSSSGQGAHLNGSGSGWHFPGVRSSTSSVSRRDVHHIERSHDEESIETNGEDMNGSTLQAMEAASPVSLEQSNGFSSSQNRERHSFQIQSPVPCSADVATNGTNGSHVPENDD
ncbi:uncharacterized protein [Littorina saxatilis]|uniref:uncharacterized protein n=1 Tax=Littorina saxatilis TaxID=31220 RepID=UPI0038B42592